MFILFIFRYTTVLRLKQLKLHQLLVSHSSALLAHEPVARPMLRFLEACANDILGYEVEKKLISLLNQLCVAIMQNIALLDLFFQPNATGKNKYESYSKNDSHYKIITIIYIINIKLILESSS